MNLMMRRRALREKKDNYKNYIRGVYKGNGANTVRLLNPNVGYNYDMIIEGVTYYTNAGNIKVWHIFDDTEYHDVYFIPHKSGTIVNLSFRECDALLIDIPENITNLGGQIFTRRDFPVVLRGINITTDPQTSLSYSGIVFCHESEISKFPKAENILGSGFEKRKSLTQTIKLLNLT